VTSLGRALWGLAAAGVAFGLIVVAFAVTSDHIVARGGFAAVGLLVGWGFIGVGLFAWRHRPENKIGSLMVATGFLWFIALLATSNIPLLFTLSSLFGSAFFATAVHMLLSIPTGELQTRGDRRLVIVAYLLAVVLTPPLILFVDPADDYGCDQCPENLLLVSDNDTLLALLSIPVYVLALVLVIGVLVSLVRRWRHATSPERRLYAPLYASGVLLMITLAVSAALSSMADDPDTLDAISLGSMVPFALVPYLLLASFVRARFVQGGAVGELVARLSEAPPPGELRDALADALGDPTLELVYWLPDDERFVDAQGRTFVLPEEGPGRAFTEVEREGQHIAAIVYDSTIPMAGEHVRAVGAAAALALANERLEAELRAKVQELRSSRERMLRIGLEERRRLERDLHDGAQQRLVSMALNMRLARASLQRDPAAAEQLLDTAGEELESALDELRELARGIHPAVLSDRGLDTALETLARRAPVPVELERLPGARLPEAIELAAYFVVAEALTNVAKYAQASHASVSVERHNGRLLVEVADDGVGGANPADGTGLRGLADRLAVIEGRLEVDSTPGRGTTIRAKIPCV
jgi:signal transduction histidine kinase